MGQCFLDYDGLKQFWKVVRDKFVMIDKDGSITVNAIRKSDSSNDFVLLAGGGVKPLSEFGSGGTASTINATLWGNSFNGSGNVNGDIVFNKPGSLSTVSQGIRLNKAGTSSVGVAVPAEGFIGFTAERGIQPNFYGISLGWGTNPEKSASSVRINDTTFTYKGNKILHAGNIGDYLPHNIYNNYVAASVYVMNLTSNDFNNIDGLNKATSDFDGLESVIESNGFPDMIKLVLTRSAHIFTLYDTDFASYAYYRCDGKNAEIVIDTDVVAFGVN